jgi:hypothetical protein
MDLAVRSGEEGELVAPCCAICLSQSLSGLVALRCGHVFHANCIGEWFKKSNKCPSCKCSIRSTDDIVKLWYKIEPGHYVPTPRGSPPPGKPLSSSTVACQTDKIESESHLKLQLQVERSRAGQLSQKLQASKAEHENTARVLEEHRANLEVARARLKEVSGCSDRETWLRDQLANAERLAEERYDKVLNDLAREKQEGKDAKAALQNAEEVINILRRDAKHMSKRNSDLSKADAACQLKYRQQVARCGLVEKERDKLLDSIHGIKQQLETLRSEKEATAAREAALKESLENMILKKSEREQVAKEYRRILTVKKSRIRAAAANGSARRGNKPAHVPANSAISASPLRAPTSERLAQLLESDVSERAQLAVSEQRSKTSTSNPPSWFASSARSSGTIPSLPAPGTMRPRRSRGE